MKKKIGVFLDYDGVLVNTLWLIYAGMVQTIAHFNGQKPTFEEFIRVYDGRGWQDMYAAFGCPRNIPVDELARVYRSFIAGEDYDQQVCFYPGAQRLLERLSADDGVVVGILSGEQEHRIRRHLQSIGVKVDFVEGNLWMGKASSIVSCARDFEVELSRVLYVDDIAGHIHCGHEAGVTTVGCIIGHPEKRAQLEEAGAHHVIANHDELEALITSFRE